MLLKLMFWSMATPMIMVLVGLAWLGILYWVGTTFLESLA
jgi:hypothetical protein